MKIVLVGSNGRLGAALAREYHKDYDVSGFNRSSLDLENLRQIRELLSPIKFDVLINCAAFTDVDLCESQSKKAFTINADVPRVLADICKRKKARLIHISTDYVFDGEKREPYAENDPARPISVYGESKRKGEEDVIAVQDRHLVVRVSWVFGRDRPSFIDKIIQRAKESEHVDAIADKFAAPTYANDIARMLPDFFPQGDDKELEGGILHFSNSGQASWQEYAQYALDCCERNGVSLKAKRVEPLKLADMKGFVARRPVFSVLSTEKYTRLAGKAPRAWRDAVADYISGFHSKK